MNDVPDIVARIVLRAVSDIQTTLAAEMRSLGDYRSQWAAVQVQLDAVSAAERAVATEIRATTAALAEAAAISRDSGLGLGGLSSAAGIDATTAALNQEIGALLVAQEQSRAEAEASRAATAASVERAAGIREETAALQQQNVEARAGIIAWQEQAAQTRAGTVAFQQHAAQSRADAAAQQALASESRAQAAASGAQAAETRAGTVAIQQQRAEIALNTAQLRLQAAETRAAAASTRQMETVVGHLAVAGLVIAGIAVITGDMAAKFQSSMELVRTQANATQHEVDAMSHSVLLLATQVGTAPMELSKGLYQIESAGFRGAAALDMLTESAKLAKVGQSDLETSAGAVVGVMAAFPQYVGQAGTVVAELNSIVGTGAIRMQQLVDSIGTGVLPTFKEAGLTLKDYGAALATLTDNHIPAEQAATRLRMTIGLIVAPSKAGAAALASIGISATQLASDLRQPNGLLGAVEDLKKHLEDSGKSAPAQMQIVEEAFGKARQSSAILGLLDELDRFKSKYEAISTGAQKFGSDWTATTETVAYQMAQLRASTDVLGISIGSVLLPAANSFLGVLTPLVTEAALWAQQNRPLVGIALAVAAAIGGIALAIRAVQLAGKILEPEISLLTKLFWADAASEDGAAVAAGHLRMAWLGILPVAALVAFALDKNNEQLAIDAASQERITDLIKQHIPILTEMQAHTLAVAQVGGSFADAERTVEEVISKNNITLTDHEKLLLAQADVTHNASLALTVLAHAYDENRVTQEHNSASLARHALMLRELEQREDGVSGALNRQHAAWVTIDKDATKYFSDLQTKASQASDALAEAIAKGAPPAQIHQLMVQAVADARSLQDAQAAQARATQMIQQALEGSARSVVTALKTMASQASVSGKQLESSFLASSRSMADGAISEAGRMRSGVLAEIDRIRTEAAKPITLSLVAPNNPVLPTITAPTLTPAYGGAEAMSPAANAAMTKLSDVIGELPPQFQSMMSGVLTSWQGKLDAVYSGYIGKLNTENKRHADALNAINTKQHTDIAAAWAQAQQQLKTENERYVGALKSENDRHAGRLQTILSTFEGNFQLALANFQAGLATAQSTAATLTQEHQDKLRELQNDYLQKIASEHGKNAAERRTADLEAYQRAVQASDDSYRKQIDAANRHISGMSGAFDRHVTSLKTTEENAVTAEKTMHQQNVLGIDGVYKRHVAGIQSSLNNHINGVKGILATEAAARLKEDQRHEGVLTTLHKNLEGALDTLAKQIAKGTSPSSILSGIDSADAASLHDAQARVILDEITHSKSLAADEAALKRVMASHNALQKIEDSVTGSHTKAKKSVDDFSTALSAASSKITTDVDRIASLLESGGNTPTQQGARQDIIERRLGGDGTGGQTQLDAAVTQLTQDYITLHRLTVLQAEAQMKAAIAEGDYSTQLKLLTDGPTRALANAQAKYAIDLHNGTGNLEADRAAIERHQKQVERWTEDQKRATATADDAVKALQAVATAADAVQRALDKISTDRTDIQVQGISDTVSAIKDETSIMQANAGVAQNQADSQISAIKDGAEIVKSELSVIAAQVTVAADESKLQVDALAAVTQRITDQTSILSAQQGVRDAQASAQESAITDGTEIMKAQYAVQTAATAADRALATAQLRQAQDKSRIDQQNAAAALAVERQKVVIEQVKMQADTARQRAAEQIDRDKLRIDTDGIRLQQATLQETIHKTQIDAQTSRQNIAIAQQQAKIASDTQKVDQANERAHMQVLLDTMQVDVDGLQIAKDQLKLSQDMLIGIGDIAGLLGSQTDYQKLINGDQSQITADQQLQTGDTTRLTNDQNLEKITAANGQLLLQQDSQQLATLQEALRQITTTGNSQLAQDEAFMSSIQQQISQDQGTLGSDTNQASIINEMMSAAVAAAEQQLQQLTNQQKDTEDAGKIQLAEDSLEVEREQLLAQKQTTAAVQSLGDQNAADIAELRSQFAKMLEYQAEAAGFIRKANVGQSFTMNTYAQDSSVNPSPPV